MTERRTLCNRGILSEQADRRITWNQMDQDKHDYGNAQEYWDQL
jgi:hypothetical protein